MAQREPASADDGDELELTPDMEVDDAEADEAEDETPADEDEPDDEGEEETVVGFDDEPEAEGADDTPVIRWMRERVKELNRENAELRKGTVERQVQELGPKPTLADLDYDEDKYDAALDEWKERKRTIEEVETSREAQTRAVEREWQQDLQGYQAKRDALAVPDFEDAAEIVKSALSFPQQAVLIKAAHDPAAFVYGLARSDARLAELAKINDPIKLAATIARMEGGLKVVKRRKAPAPDRPVKGSSKLPGGTDKQLEKLEAEAQNTGNRTAVIAYRKKLAAKGKK